MSGYVSARDALLRDIESAEAALQGAVERYAEVERKLHDAQRSAGIAYEARAKNVRNVFRLKRALSILDGDEDQAETAPDQPGSTGTGNKTDGGL